MSEVLIDHQAAQRFEMGFDGHVAYADYHKVDDNIYIDYVFAPEVLRGTGAAGKLMAAIIDYASARALQPVPICGYARTWMERHNKLKL